MLAAVTSDDGRFERLSGYVLGGRKRAAPPLAVPTELVKSAKLPSKPGETPPGVRGKIPTSSQRPYQPTNACIPYARLMFTSTIDSAAPREVQCGDLLFVYKNSNTVGSGPNRTAKCCGIPQLNEMLRQHQASAQGSLDLADPETRKRVKQVRIQHYTDLLARARRDQDALEDGQDTKALVDVTVYKQKLAYAKAFDTNVPQNLPQTSDYDPDCDAKAVPLVSNWVLDGVLRTIDDDELGMDAAHGGRDEGVLFNVAVQGPTPMRNSSWGVQATSDVQLLPRNAWLPQFVDEHPLALDEIFAVLVSNQVVRDNGAVFFNFYWKIGTSRQIFAAAVRSASLADFDQREPQRRLKDAVGIEKGLDYSEMLNAWSVYSVGRVMDTLSVARKGNDRQLTLNVKVREHTRRDFLDRFFPPKTSAAAVVAQRDRRGVRVDPRSVEQLFERASELSKTRRVQQDWMRKAEEDVRLAELLEEGGIDFALGFEPDLRHVMLKELS